MLAMDMLTAFGLFSVTAMLVLYALEDRSPWFALAFAPACQVSYTEGGGSGLPGTAAGAAALSPASLLEVRLQSVAPVGSHIAYGATDKKTYACDQNELQGAPPFPAQRALLRRRATAAGDTPASATITAAVVLMLVPRDSPAKHLV